MFIRPFFPPQSSQKTKLIMRVASFRQLRPEEAKSTKVAQQRHDKQELSAHSFRLVPANLLLFGLFVSK